MGSTLYADRGPPFGLPELYGDQWKVASILVNAAELKKRAADQARAASGMAPVMHRAWPLTFVDRLQ